MNASTKKLGNLCVDGEQTGKKQLQSVRRTYLRRKMKSEHSKTLARNLPKQPTRGAAPYVLVSSFFAAGLLLFAGQTANAQETTIAPEATVVANEVAATDTTLAVGEVMTAESTQLAAADIAVATLDSTPVGGMETGFGGTAPSSNSTHSGLYFAGAAGATALGALGLRKFSKQSTARSNHSKAE
jgi:hypothetical protein